MQRRVFLGTAVLATMAARTPALANSLPVMNLSTLDGNDPAATIAELVLRSRLTESGWVLRHDPDRAGTPNPAQANGETVDS